MNILSFCIFWMVFMSLIIIVTPWHFNFYCFEVGIDDLI